MMMVWHACLSFDYKPSGPKRKQRSNSNSLLQPTLAALSHIKRSSRLALLLLSSNNTLLDRFRSLRRTLTSSSSSSSSLFLCFRELDKPLQLPQILLSARR